MTPQMTQLERLEAENLLLSRLRQIKAEVQLNKNPWSMWIRVPGHDGAVLSHEQYHRLLELVHDEIMTVTVNDKRVGWNFGAKFGAGLVKAIEKGGE